MIGCEAQGPDLTPHAISAPTSREGKKTKEDMQKTLQRSKGKEAERKEVSESKRNLLFIREKSNRKLRDILATNARSQVCFQDAPRGGVSQSHPTLTLTNNGIFIRHMPFGLSAGLHRPFFSS